MIVHVIRHGVVDYDFSGLKSLDEVHERSLTDWNIDEDRTRKKFLEKSSKIKDLVANSKLVYTSGLTRAKQTAKLIMNELDIYRPTVSLDFFNEIDWLIGSVFESFEDFEAINGKDEMFVRLYKMIGADAPVDGVEHISQVIERINSGFSIIDEYPAVLFAHGGLMRFFRAYAENPHKKLSDITNVALEYDDIDYLDVLTIDISKLKNGSKNSR